MNRKRSLQHISRRERRRAGHAYERRAVHHARNRLGERYGLYLSTEDFWALVRAIQAGQVRRLYDDTPWSSWYVVRVEGRPALAVYDHRQRVIRTFVALEQLACIGLRAEDVA